MDQNKNKDIEEIKNNIVNLLKENDFNVVNFDLLVNQLIETMLNNKKQ